MGTYDEYRRNPGIEPRMPRPDDPYRIVPQGAMAATVRPLDLQVRTIVEYDVLYMQDRVRADLFANGLPLGIYAIAAVGRDDVMSPAEALRVFGPELERMIVEEFMGLGYRRRIKDLEDQVQRLHEDVHRERWWQFRPQRLWLRSLVSREGRARRDA